MLAKVTDWLGAGTTLVWVADPERRQLRVYRAHGSESIVADGDRMGGRATLPGSSLSLTGLFD